MFCVCVWPVKKSEPVWKRLVSDNHRAFTSHPLPFSHICKLESPGWDLYFIKCPDLANTDLVWHLKHSVVSCVWPDFPLFTACIPWQQSIAHAQSTWRLSWSLSMTGRRKGHLSLIILIASQVLESSAQDWLIVSITRVWSLCVSGQLFFLGSFILIKNSIQ